MGMGMVVCGRVMRYGLAWHQQHRRREERDTEGTGSTGNPEVLERGMDGWMGRVADRAGRGGAGRRARFDWTSCVAVQSQPRVPARALAVPPIGSPPSYFNYVY